MMRNPFRLRASKRSVRDEQFVRLFAPSALDLLNDVAEPWSGVLFLHSAPGGGKTTLQRLLTPGPLKKILRMQDEDVRPTRDALLKAGAVTPDGMAILGVTIGFTNEYRDLDEITESGGRAKGVFRALINARIVLATLRALLERAERSYPDDLGQLKASWSPVDGATIPAEATGQELHQWASKIEESVFEVLDDLGADGKPSPRVASGLEALDWLSTAILSDAAGTVDLKRVLLLDDLQFLTDDQSTWLRETITGARAACGVWIAERLEALPPEDLLAEGALEDRDYDGEIRLERRWRKRGPAAYAKFVDQIADLRARDADGFEGRKFFPALADDLDPAAWDKKFDAQSAAIEKRLLARVGNQQRYDQWFAQRRAGSGTPRERALAWREVEILIERDLAKSQKTFDFDALTEEELSDKENSGVRAAAEVFLSREAQAPLYFGRQKLAALSSSNVDQFVELAGDLFEELTAKSVRRRTEDAVLSAERQHAILKRAAERRWDGIPRRVPRGYEARRFLEAVGAFCESQTYRPTAPYPPGVTGFGITMQDRALLIDDSRSANTFADLRGMLAALVSQNLLEPTLDHKNKGESLIIFNLNRVLCAHFDLPLGYGGWRKKSLRELNDWLAKGRQAVTPEKSLV
jgi:hypothetical protein